MNNSFPVILVNIEDEVNTEVDIPHKGYSIQTVMENGKNEESRILNEKIMKITS